MTRRSVPISLVMFNPAMILKMYRIWRRIGYDHELWSAAQKEGMAVWPER